MKNTFIIQLIFITAFCGLAFCTGRLELGSNPSKLYKEFIEHVDKNEMDKAKGLVPGTLTQVCSEINKKYSKDLIAELNSRLSGTEGRQAKDSLIKIVCYDTKLIFALIQEKNTDDAASLSEWVKSAYANYIAISPEIQEKDMVTDWKVRKMFNMLFSKLAASGYTDKTVILDSETMNSIFEITGKIEETLDTTLSGLK